MGTRSRKVLSFVNKGVENVSEDRSRAGPKRSRKGSLRVSRASRSRQLPSARHHYNEGRSAHPSARQAREAHTPSALTPRSFLVSQSTVKGGNECCLTGRFADCCRISGILRDLLVHECGVWTERIVENFAQRLLIGQHEEIWFLVHFPRFQSLCS